MKKPKLVNSFFRLMTQRIKSKGKREATLEENAESGFRRVEFTIGTRESKAVSGNES